MKSWKLRVKGEFQVQLAPTLNRGFVRRQGLRCPCLTTLNTIFMKKTLLVLGAGASKDFCRIFPTGLELIKEINYHFLTEKKYPEVHQADGIYLSALMNDIVRTFNDDTDLFKIIKNQLWDIQLHYEWKSLRNNSDNPVSIDNFIKTNIENGKLNPKAENIIQYSIYYLLKGTEQAYTEGDYDKKDNWIAELVKTLSAQDFNSIYENMTVITFNYDRIFEKYFVDYLNEFIFLGSEESLSLQKNIIHVYGSLGSLNEVAFDLPNSQVDILKQKYRQIELVDRRKQLTLPIADAEKYREIHFIGFGYDDTNLGLLNLKQFPSASLHGTAYYYTNSQIRFLKTKYNINAEPITCKDYIKKLRF
jgi:hypothetical protein